MPARLSIARWRSASPSGCSLYRASSNREVRVSEASRETRRRSTARPSSSLGVRAPCAVIPRAPRSAQNRWKHARITDRTSPPTSSSSIASTELTKRTRKTSPRRGSRKPRAVGSVPPAALPPGIASPPVSRFATLNASAATRTIARNRSRGTAHSVRPRHGRITTVRRRRALITVSRTAAGDGTSGDAELLEELLPPLLADEPQGEGDQAGDDGEDERDAREGDRSAERAGCLGRRRG